MRAMVEASGCPLSISVAAEDHRAPWSDAPRPDRGRRRRRAPDPRPGRRPRHRRAARPGDDVQPVLGRARVPRGRRPATRGARCGRSRNPSDARRCSPRPAAARGSTASSSSPTRPTTSRRPSDSLAARASQGRRPRGARPRPPPRRRWPRASLPAVPQLGRRLTRRHRPMLADPNLVPGLSDGGAHVGTICDASYPTTLLAHWARDREPGLPVEWIVARQCRATAEAVGLLDRGVLRRGMRADVNVIDHELAPRPPPVPRVRPSRRWPAPVATRRRLPAHLRRRRRDLRRRRGDRRASREAGPRPAADQHVVVNGTCNRTGRPSRDQAPSLIVAPLRAMARSSVPR